jgi:hypothetical protein
MKDTLPEVYAKKKTHYSESGDRPLCGAENPDAISDNPYKCNCLDCLQKVKRGKK